MQSFRALQVVVVSALAPYAAAQLAPVTQERTVQTQAMVSSGASDNDFDEAVNFGPFVSTIGSAVTGASGASAQGGASQNSSLSPGLITASLGASGVVSTGATFVVGESDATSSFLYIFSIASPTEVEFLASGSLAFVGRNPDGEPSDLFGLSRIRLIDADTEEIIAGLQLNGDADSDTTSFNGTLAPGQYVILATAQVHAYSADLLGPPPRSGSGEATATFSLAVVPAPGAAAVVAFGVLGVARRRRAGR